MLAPSKDLFWRLSPLAAAMHAFSRCKHPQVITANPLGSNQFAWPASVLEGDDLTFQQAGSLGETLNKQPGVSSSYFGLGASRPIIPGQDDALTPTDHKRFDYSFSVMVGCRSVKSQPRGSSPAGSSY